VNIGKSHPHQNSSNNSIFLPVHIIPSQKDITITDYNSVIQQYKVRYTDSTFLNTPFIP
jgi:hypothetical protein